MSYVIKNLTHLSPVQSVLHFVEGIFKCIFSILIQISTEVCSNRQYAIMGLGNGSVTNWRKAITWTNDDQDL